MASMQVWRGVSASAYARHGVPFAGLSSGRDPSPSLSGSRPCVMWRKHSRIFSCAFGSETQGCSRASFSAGVSSRRLSRQSVENSLDLRGEDGVFCEVSDLLTCILLPERVGSVSEADSEGSFSLYLERSQLAVILGALLWYAIPPVGGGSALAAELTDEASKGGDGATDSLLVFLFSAAFLALVVLTVGVIYLGASEFMEKRAQTGLQKTAGTEKLEKLEPVEGTGPKGFGPKKLRKAEKK